ncbi:L-serine ammonia-lyase, iron-sulfur-dependent subunit beta [Thermicanus aegyptius]|uniref:L-serine ammonia-lyase, iron-sulfur-dependent subunit beta n=1 Tax=Thermicanus aegyptius TaxID=94009 RepID=UPI000413840B|nr:L-serine ammonia-lyase, iron-sulfur-dependent subunit beta [Thermicanus aegyptius]
MKYRSVFDIIGPIMIGPSSSHTAGAARIGRMARSLFGRKPERAEITFYGSFAQTYKGHGTEVAIVGGILDFDTFDPRMVDSLTIAKEKGIQLKVDVSEEPTDHPNTARVCLEDEKGRLEIVGISIGGGKVEIVELNGFKLSLSGEYPALLVLHEDRFGMIAAVANLLSKHEINIGNMQVSRKGKGKEALMIIETDQNVPPPMAEEIRKIPFIMNVAVIWP